MKASNEALELRRVPAGTLRTVARRARGYVRYIEREAPPGLAYRIAYEAQIRIRAYAHIMPRSRYNDGFNDYLNAAGMRAALRGEADS